MATTTNTKNTMTTVEINGVKQTERTRYARLLTLVQNSDLPEVERTDLETFINHKTAQLDRKSESKASAEKVAIREKIKSAVIEYLQDNSDKWFTVSEIIKGSPKLGLEYSTSAVTYALKELLTAGKVQNERDKKRSLYAIAVD